jgi:long-subunit fatty acid transport protein
MLKTKITLLISLLLLLISGNVGAQNNTSSPYSRFGYGELANPHFGKSSAMGGTGIGVRSQNSINNLNPAAYTAIDSMTFLFEIGFMGKQSWYSNETSAYQKFTGNIEYFSLEFPITRYLAFSAGIQPFSYVGYDFATTDSVAVLDETGQINENTKMVHYQSAYSGTGGTYKVYGGLSGKIGKHFAAGIDLNYLYGNIENLRTLTFLESTVGYASTQQYINLELSDISFRYGLQYFTDLNNNRSLTAGLVFEPKTKLDGKYTVGTNTADTTTVESGSWFELPLMIGVGASYEIKKKLLLAGDFSFTDWSNAKYFGEKDTLVSQYSLNLGAEYLPNKNSKKYFSRVRYRAGFHYTTGYIEVNDEIPNNLGISFGMGLPVKGKSVINVGAEYGKTGKKTQMREEYFKFTISASFGETWFFKRKFD